MAGHHHGDFPQLSMGRGKAEHHACGTTTISSAPSSTRNLSYAKVARRLRPEGRHRHAPSRSSPTALQCRPATGADDGRCDHLHRGYSQPGTRRTFPPRCHENTRSGCRHRRCRHAPTSGRLVRFHEIQLGVTYPQLTDPAYLVQWRLAPSQPPELPTRAWRKSGSATGGYAVPNRHARENSATTKAGPDQAILTNRLVRA